MGLCHNKECFDFWSEDMEEGDRRRRSVEVPLPLRLQGKGSPSTGRQEVPRRWSSSRVTPAEVQFIIQNAGNVEGAYDLKDKLGEGSFGIVYKGVHKKSQAERAIKAMPKGHVDRDKLRLEFKLMMSLDHPHLIRLFETFEDQHHIYLILDLCLGGELFHRIASCGHFTEVEASAAMSQILSAVQYMHEMDVCHRDLKPENFLLTSQEDVSSNCIKIVDFGLSCKAKANEALTVRAGTPLYISPQVLMGRYTRLCDIWSCGVILYIMLCGHPPFTGETAAEIFQNVRRSEYAMTGPTWKSVSRDAKDLVKGMLRRLEARRLTASEAMSHVWIRQRAPQATGDDLPSVMFLNLKNFHAQNKLKRAALRIIAGQLSNGQMIQLRKAFSLLDTNGDGLLTLEELRQGMEDAGLESGPELEDILRAMDVDGNGLVSYTEFLAAALDRRRHLSQEVCETAFRIFDINGDGLITESELGQMLADSAVQDSLGRAKVGQILAEVDTDGDGKIDFDEFMSMMCSGNDPELLNQEDSASDDESMSGLSDLS